MLCLDGESPEQSYELDVIENLLLEDTAQCVRQLTLEAHFFGPLNDTRSAAELRKTLNVFKRLERSGFKLLDFQAPIRNFFSGKNLMTSFTEGDDPVTCKMLWGNDKASPCVW